jgi:hypothetical protein
MAQVSALIGDLDKRAQLLEYDIAAEEKRARVFNRSDAAYPIAARILAVRRDNLKATIATLERRLARLQGAEMLPAQASAGSNLRAIVVKCRSSTAASLTRR